MCLKMREFFYFLLRYRTFLYFLLLEGISMFLLFNYNAYQRSAFLSSSNAVVGGVHSVTEGVANYFRLGKQNEVLAEENAELRNQLADLQRRLDLVGDTPRVEVDTVRRELAEDTIRQFNYYDAKVINSTTRRARNFLTINKGKNAGIRREMAVINGQGVVGMVSAVSDHFSTILPLINTGMRLSVKIKNSNFRGQLKWEGGNYRMAILNDVPEHAFVNVGDSIVTSGSSDFFPEGLFVGVVEEVNMDKNGGFYSLPVRLAVDFNSIYHVEIIENSWRREQVALENEVEEEE